MYWCYFLPSSSVFMLHNKRLGFTTVTTERLLNKTALLIVFNNFNLYQSIKDLRAKMCGFIQPRHELQDLSLPHGMTPQRPHTLIHC